MLISETGQAHPRQYHPLRAAASDLGGAAQEGRKYHRRGAGGAAQATQGIKEEEKEKWKKYTASPPQRPLSG